MQNHHGLLVIDKPGGMTSRDVVNRCLGWFPRGTRLGHMGTLDPLATGVLVLGVGDGTRLTELVQDMDKVYRAGILLGAQSDSDDADGQVTPVAAASPPSEEMVARELGRWIGEVEQVPPNYSAIKVTGRRAYDLSRQGKPVALAARKVRIYDICQLHYAYPHLELEVRCGKGTYIRSLARDLGQSLGCGGLIASLRRLRVGPFTPDLAVPLDAASTPALLPLSLAVSELPALKLDPGKIDLLRQGQAIPWPVASRSDTEEMCAIFTAEGGLVGIGSMDEEQLRPVRILTGR